MSVTSAQQPSLVDLATVAQRLGVNQRHIRRLVAERRIPFVKWGHLLRFDPAEVDAWLDAHRSGPDAPA
jgi:excisionase family DNA binding protein